MELLQIEHGTGAREFIIQIGFWSRLDTLILTVWICTFIPPILYYTSSKEYFWIYEQLLREHQRIHLLTTVLSGLWTLSKAFAIKQESLLQLEDLGIQLTSTTMIGTTNSLFIPMRDLERIVIAEGILG